MNELNPNLSAPGFPPLVASRATAALGSRMRRLVADFACRHIVLAVNAAIFGVVAGMSFLVMVLPFSGPTNVLLASAAVIVGLAWTYSIE